MLNKLKAKGFDIRALHHAEAIIEHDLPAALEDLEAALLPVRITAEELVRGGGGEGQFTQRLRKTLADSHGWKKHSFEIKKLVDGKQTESLTHEIDHVKEFAGGTFALEIEWNNKDPFFDRDLENFKRLHSEGVISVGGIVTRGVSLHEGMAEIIEGFARRRGLDNVAQVREFYRPTQRQEELIAKAVKACGSFDRGWARAFVADKFGEATTHWRKLEERIHRGVGNPCPLLLVGIPRSTVVL